MNARITMQSHAENYLNERHQLGFRLRSIGQCVKSFARYVDRRGHRGPLTVELMAAWARRDKWHSDKPSTWAQRLKNLRSFTRYLQQFEPRTEVPDDAVFGRIGQRLAPHIYTEPEIVDLLEAARRLRSTPDLRGATYEALFGLIASSGLRVSEAVHLRDSDVDLKRSMLTVRQTKFAKSRHVPLHPTTVEALKRYRRLRNSYIELTEETPFFVGSRGKRLGHALGLRQVNKVFEHLRNQLGWINRGAHDNPRIHDMRHYFIVRRLPLWHAQGVDIDQAMLALCTYVGHAHATDTYWYLTGVPQLMAIAASKFESFMQTPEVHHA